ncbi:hypothetical protein FRC10_004284, partial [Ceratobasidium sp. 414]
REGLIQNDAALRALCEGLEMEMFGVGGYDGFVASVVHNFKDNGYAMDFVGENNGGNGDVSPKKSRQSDRLRLTYVVQVSTGLVLSSQGASASISPSDSVQSRRPNDLSLPESVMCVAGKLAVPSPQEEQHDVVMAEVSSEPIAHHFIDSAQQHVIIVASPLFLIAFLVLGSIR